MGRWAQRNDWTRNPWDEHHARLEAGLVLARVAFLLAGVVSIALVLVWAFRP